jgi:hypothetical protein
MAPASRARPWRTCSSTSMIRTSARPASASRPDGSLYVMRLVAIIIGHMQHHLRDPNRDHDHGRIYRITYEGRPLLTPPKIDGQPIPPCSKCSRRRRTMCARGPRSSSASATAKRGHHRPGQMGRRPRQERSGLRAPPVPRGAVGPPMAQRRRREPAQARLLARPTHSMPALAPPRVLCYWRDRVPDALALLKACAPRMSKPRVRLEAVRAASFLSTWRCSRARMRPPRCARRRSWLWRKQRNAQCPLTTLLGMLKPLAAKGGPALNDACHFLLLQPAAELRAVDGMRWSQVSRDPAAIPEVAAPGDHRQP